MKLVNEHDYTSDDIVAADEANEAAIKKIDKKAWCKKLAVELKKFQPAADDQPVSFFPNMATEQKVTLLITIKMHGPGGALVVDHQGFLRHDCQRADPQGPASEQD